MGAQLAPMAPVLRSLLALLLRRGRHDLRRALDPVQVVILPDRILHRHHGLRHTLMVHGAAERGVRRARAGRMAAGVDDADVGRLARRDVGLGTALVLRHGVPPRNRLGYLRDKRKIRVGWRTMAQDLVNAGYSNSPCGPCQFKKPIVLLIGGIDLLLSPDEY